MRAIKLNIPEDDMKKLDELVEAKFYPNRSEAIRFAIHDITKPPPRVDHIDKLLELCVKWNKREVEGDKAMYEIYKLFWSFGLKQKWNQSMKSLQKEKSS